MEGCAGRPASALHHYRVILSGATQWRSRRIRSFRIRFVVFGIRILRRFAAQNDMRLLMVRRGIPSPGEKVDSKLTEAGNFEDGRGMRAGSWQRAESFGLSG